MTDKSQFVETMWTLTVIPLFAFFCVALFFVVVAVLGFLLGSTESLQTDSFKFFSLMLVLCVPLYVVLWLTRKIVLSAMNGSLSGKNDG